MTSEENVSKESLKVEERPPSLSKALRIFLLFATVIIITITLVLTLKKPPAFTQAELQQEIQSVQAQLPVRIDPYTELKRVEAGEMQINYSFMVTDDPTALSGGLGIKDDNFSQQVETAVKTSACINKKTRRYINSGVSLAYSYVTNDNVALVDFVIPAGFCK